MNVKFFTLLYIADSIETQRLSGKEVKGEERILIYLKNCHSLNYSLKLNNLQPLIVLTNRKFYLESLKDKYKLSFEIMEISFDLPVPPNIGFYSAHFKIDAYRFLATLRDTYSFLLDNDVICTQNMPNNLKELIEQNYAVYYSFPIYRVEKHNINIMKYIEPAIVSGEWSGGEFIGGNALFYNQLYNEISGFANRYFKRIDEMFHQGDEMLTSIALEKMRLNGYKIVEGGCVNLIYRYYSIYEDKELNYYHSWMNHLICDKKFLANINYNKYKSNDDFFSLYNQYLHTTVRIKKIYHFLKEKFKTLIYY